MKKLKGTEEFAGLTRAEPTLPAAWYYDRDWYEEELEKIFYRHWVYLCHVSVLDQPRSFRRFKIGYQELLVVRDGEGVLRGFYNTCRHRGSLLCVEQSGQLDRRLLRCPYHQWSYSLDGKLIATSSHRVSADFERENFPLLPIQLKEWRGGLYACLADQTPEFSDGFSRGSDRTESWPMEELVVGHEWRKEMECNWKVFWENFNECLHCPNIHPELCELVPLYGRRISHPSDFPDWQEHQDDTRPEFAGGLRKGAMSWSYDGSALDTQFESLSIEEIERGQSYFVSLPSVYIAAHVDYMRTVRVLPLGPESTEISVEWLFPREALPLTQHALDNIVNFSVTVMQQDATASELNQAGLHARQYHQGVLMPEEHHVKSFHDWVRDQIGEKVDSPT